MCMVRIKSQFFYKYKSNAHCLLCNNSVNLSRKFVCQGICDFIIKKKTEDFNTNAFIAIFPFVYLCCKRKQIDVKLLGI